MRYLTSRFFGPAFVMAAVFVSNGLAQTTNQTEAPAATERLAPRQHGPAQIRGRRPDNSVESTNWSGYAVTGSDFTEVKGSWIVPAVDCTVTPGTKSTPAYSSFWVGIDGYSSNTVEQIGTDSDCDRSTPVYYAWYEFYPAGSYEINLAISPGNKVSAEVSYSGSEFTVTITNISTGATFSKTENVRKAKRSSAEWIAEAPCCARGGSMLPLSDFGTVELGLDNTSVSNTNYAANSSTPLSPISIFGSSVEDIVMVTSGGVDEAVPSSLSSDGSSFTVVWKSE